MEVPDQCPVGDGVGSKPAPVILLQVAGDRRGTGQSLPGQRKLPRPVLLYREAPEVLSDWSSSGGEIGRSPKRESRARRFRRDC